MRISKIMVSICILQYILDFGHSRMRLGLKSDFFRNFPVLRRFWEPTCGHFGRKIDIKRGQKKDAKKMRHKRRGRSQESVEGALRRGARRNVEAGWEDLGGYKISSEQARTGAAGLRQGQED